ncbi:hypothetical protein RT21_00335 [Pseudomonas sp. 10B238]|nr:hypothetical protein RT21_00335 [Pseudomonas sp. 10B238]
MFAKPFDQPPRNGYRRLHADLLAYDRPHCLLERIEGARQAQPWGGSDQRSDVRVCSKMPSYDCRIGVEVEHLPNTHHQRHGVFG